MRRTSEGCLSSSARATRRDYGPGPRPRRSTRTTTNWSRRRSHATKSPDRASLCRHWNFITRPSGPEEPMRALRVLTTTVATIGLLAAASYGVGYAVRHGGGPGTGRTEAAASSPQPTAAPGTTAPATTAPTSPATSPDSRPTTQPTPENVLEPGASGVKVRELQARLFQLAWLPETTTGHYDPATRTAV